MEIIEVPKAVTLLWFAWLKNTQKVNRGDYQSNAEKKTESFLPPNGPELNKDRVSSSLSYPFSLCGTTLLMDTIV